MEGDRTASLIVQAAVDGLIDYSKARLRDNAWWRRLRILLKGVQRKNHLVDLTAAYNYELALLSNSRLTDESFQSGQERAKELYYDIVSILRPWEGANYAERKKQEFDDHRQSYIDAFGVDPLDPEFQEWEAQQIDKINAGEFDTDEESDEARVTRLLRDRMTTG